MNEISTREKSTGENRGNRDLSTDSLFSPFPPVQFWILNFKLALAIALCGLFSSVATGAVQDDGSVLPLRPRDPTDSPGHRTPPP